jgi:hypothetical protein
MVDAFVFSCFLIGCEISRVLDHHNLSVISLGTLTDGAQILIGQRKTFLAIAHILPCAADGVGQRLDALRRHVDNMKRKALRGLSSDARQRGQLFHEPCDLFAVVVH